MRSRLDSPVRVALLVLRDLWAGEFRLGGSPMGISTPRNWTHQRPDDGNCRRLASTLSGWPHLQCARSTMISVSSTDSPPATATPWSRRRDLTTPDVRLVTRVPDRAGPRSAHSADRILTCAVIPTGFRGWCSSRGADAPTRVDARH